jgi:hypothetical protein
MNVRRNGMVIKATTKNMWERQITCVKIQFVVNVLAQRHIIFRYYNYLDMGHLNPIVFV